jgi:hypothetical protein
MSTLEIALCAAFGSFVFTLCSLAGCQVLRRRFQTPDPIVCVNPTPDRCIAKMIAQDESEVFDRSSNPKSSDTSEEE